MAQRKTGATRKPRSAPTVPMCDCLDRARDIHEAVAQNDRTRAIVLEIAEDIEREHEENCLHGGGT